MTRNGGPAQLVTEARHAVASGNHRQACDLYEQACEFELAAEQAVAAGDYERALWHGAATGRTDLVEASLLGLKGHPELGSIAHRLRNRRVHHIAGRIFEQIGDLEQAADAYSAAERILDAVRCYRALGNQKGAGRLLEQAHQSRVGGDAITLEFGRTLIEFGLHRKAIDVLQERELAPPFRAEQVAALAHSLEHLGFTQAAQTLRATSGQPAQAHPAPVTSAATTPIPLLYHRYANLEEVSKSSYARIFRATDSLTGHEVAIKQIHSQAFAGTGRDALSRMKKEATSLGRLRLPHVVALVDFIENDGIIVTHWMAGGGLDALLQRESVTAAKAAELVCTILTALAEAHRLGILHRDIKPSNLLFDQAGTVHISDFGTAHISDTAATATAGVIGTLSYMSPEQKRGQPACAASDVYSVGATFAEMLTGHSDGSRRPSSAHRELTTAHDALLDELLAESPKDRPVTALQARDRILSLTWPRSIPTKSNESATPAVEPNEERWVARLGGVFWDQRLGRLARLMPRTGDWKSIVRAYASIHSASLSAVLGSDDRGVWMEVPQGTPIERGTQPATLRGLQVRDPSVRQSLHPGHHRCSGSKYPGMPSPSRLGGPGASTASLAGSLTWSPLNNVLEVLSKLHMRGVTHGSVDREHILVRGGIPVLSFEPATANTVAAKDDVEALTRLAEWLLATE